MTKYNKAIMALREMKLGVEYPIKKEQKEILIELFMSDLVIPTKPTPNYDYYYLLGENMNTITKIEIK